MFTQGYQQLDEQMPSLTTGDDPSSRLTAATEASVWHHEPCPTRRTSTASGDAQCGGPGRPPAHTWLPDTPLDIGGHRLSRRVHVRETPHVPHEWESQVVFEEHTGTLFCGDLGTQLGDGPASTSDSLADRALEAERAFRQLSSPAAAAATLRDLATWGPTTLAVMHGSSFTGDGAAELEALASAYERLQPRSATATAG